MNIKNKYVIVLTLLSIFILLGETRLIAQTQNNSVNHQLDSLKDPIAEFNAKRVNLSSPNFQDLIIENLKSDADLGVVLNYLDKLDDKIVRLVYVRPLKKLKIFYATDFTVVDIMQGLKSIGYPAYYLADNGDHSYINGYGAIEFIQMNK